MPALWPKKQITHPLLPLAFCTVKWEQWYLFSQNHGAGFFLFKFIYFNWRLITLQYWIGSEDIFWEEIYKWLKHISWQLMDNLNVIAFFLLEMLTFLKQKRIK